MLEFFGVVVACCEGISAPVLLLAPCSFDTRKQPSDLSKIDSRIVVYLLCVSISLQDNEHEFLRLLLERNMNTEITRSVPLPLSAYAYV